MNRIRNFIESYLKRNKISHNTLSYNLGYTKSYVVSLKKGHLGLSKNFVERMFNKAEMIEDEKTELLDIYYGTFGEDFTESTDPADRKRSDLFFLFNNKIDKITDSQIDVIRIILDRENFAEKIKSNMVKLT